MKHIKTPVNLISYLVYKANAIDNQKLLHQYTSTKAVLNILTSQKWYIGSPEKMNDQNEFENFKTTCSKIWNGIFFTCFMEEQSENIAMWSEYAQPWEKGVRISFPASKIKEWEEGILTVLPANPLTKEPLKEESLPCHTFHHSRHMVAYTNEEDFLKGTVTAEKISVGKSECKTMTQLYSKKELCGYIKNIAWSYEKELRLRISVPYNNKYPELKGILVPIPEYVLNSMIITKGPKLSENDPEWVEIKNKFSKILGHNIKESIFEGKLQYMACDRCEYKKKNKLNSDY